MSDVSLLQITYMLKVLTGLILLKTVCLAPCLQPAQMFLSAKLSAKTDVLSERSQIQGNHEAV